MSKTEDDRYFELEMLQRAKKIDNLSKHPKFKLRGEKGILIATYTPDSKYRLREEMYGFKAGTWIIEEHKGSKDMWAYKRRDYSIFRRWVIVDYPEYTFIESFPSGEIKQPRIRLPKDKD